MTSAADSVSMPAVAVGVTGKLRSPWAVLGLCLITLGIYGLYWQYKMFQEMKDYSGRGIGGGLGLLLAILIGVVNMFLMPNELAGLYLRDGQEAPVSAKTGFWVLLPLLGGFVWLFKVQGRTNEFWESKGVVKG